MAKVIPDNTTFENVKLRRQQTANAKSPVSIITLSDARLHEIIARMERKALSERMRKLADEG